LKRIANGSGVQVRDVNALIKQFTQMQKMMKMMRGGKGRKMMKAMKSKMGDMPSGGSDLPSNLPGL
jgi:signal recognition particle subunit SRP54